MFETLPGFREFYPDQCIIRLGLFDRWRKALLSCGFEEYDSPVLEPLDLYIEKSGNEIVEQLFHFEDKGGRRVALRPEMTPTLARMVGSRANALRRPVKWFNIGDHFRYERMQKGRTRCFTQLNADILGEPSVAADVEAVYSLILVCRSLGLSAQNFYVRLSDRDLWLLAFRALGIAPENDAGLLGVIDKIERSKPEDIEDKIGQLLGGRGSSFLSAVQALFEVKSVEAIETWFSSNSTSESEWETALSKRLESWKLLTHELDEMGCAGYYEIDLSIVRGLAYYTGFVFEAFERGRNSRALAGGGRYNHLIEKLGGPAFPAVGWAMGDVTMLDCLMANELVPVSKNAQSVFFVIDPSVRSQALGDLDLLRSQGIPARYSYKTSGFGKQLKEANQWGCEFAVFYGSEVLETDEIVIKNLLSGESKTLSRNAWIKQVNDNGSAGF